MNKHLLQQFKPRVYGILESKGKFLVSHESFSDKHFCKFPGGGMEFGESPLQCLQRELMEELKIKPLSMTQYRVSETVVQNRFNPSQQVIGIYYRFTVDEMGLNRINKQLDLTFMQGSLTHVKREWLSGKELLNALSFAMDKDVVSDFV